MKNRKKTTPRKIAIATSGALAALLQANMAQANTPYPQVPLVWQSGTSAIKPNILLFLDTSGSMRSAVPNSGGRNRIQVGRDVIREVIDETRERNRWGLATFLSGANYSAPGTNLRAWDSLSPSSTVMATNFGGWVWGNYNNGGGRIGTSSGPGLPHNSPGYSIIGGQIRNEVRDVDSANPANYTALINRLNTLVPETWTPIPGSYYELIRYYRGMTPGLQGLRAPDGSGRYTSPIQYRCQRNYIIYISDGQPTATANRYQLGALRHQDPMMTPLHTALAAQANTNTGMADLIAGFAANNDLIIGGTDAEGVSFDDPAFKDQTITTFTIGFAEDIPLLRNMATMSGGTYVQANDPAQLKQALLGSLNAIARAGGFTPSTPSVTSSPDGRITSAASTNLDPSTWTSELRFYPYDSTTGRFDTTTFSTAKYQNGSTLTSRALFSTAGGVALVAPGSYPSGFDNNLFGISPTRTDLPTTDPLVLPITRSGNTNEYRNLMAWLLRWNPSDIDSGTNYRDRNNGSSISLNRFMGDVSGNVSVFGSIKVPAASLSDFDRREFIAIPSNDGMLHILQVNTGADNNTKPYTEVLQYIPGTAQRDTATDTVMRSLVFTAEKTYGDLRNPKLNFLSGELLNIKVDNEISVVGSMGSGARGAYSLMVGGKDYSGNDVGLHRPHSDWGTSVPWWDTSTSQFGAAGSFYNELGYNFGMPKVGYVSMNGGNWTTSTDVRAAGLLTSGMDDPSQNTPGLFVLDHMAKNYANGANRASTGQPGQLIRKIPITRSYSATPTAGTSVAQIIQAHDGLTSAQAVDLNGDGISDLAYAGDYKGNIWRFDLRGPSPASWGARMVYQGSGTQPLVAEPRLKVWAGGIVGIYFGTGSNLYQADLSAHDTQSVYGVFDHATDCPLSAPATGVCSVATRSDLIQQTLVPETVGSDYGLRITSGNNYVNVATRRGFYLDIPDNTYRVTTTAEVVTLGGRESAVAVWNIEQMSGSSTSSGAQMTCTPDKVSSSGVRLMADAHNGAVNPYINWTNAVTNTAGQKLDTVPYAGASSSSLLFNAANTSAYRASGMLSSGELFTAGSEPDPNAHNFNCYKAGEIVSGSSESGVQVDSITCDNPSAGVRRLSWREIF